MEVCRAAGSNMILHLPRILIVNSIRDLRFVEDEERYGDFGVSDAVLIGYAARALRGELPPRSTLICVNNRIKGRTGLLA